MVFLETRENCEPVRLIFIAPVPGLPNYVFRSGSKAMENLSLRNLHQLVTYPRIYTCTDHGYARIVT